VGNEKNGPDLVKTGVACDNRQGDPPSRVEKKKKKKQQKKQREQGGTTKTRKTFG